MRKVINFSDNVVVKTPKNVAVSLCWDVMHGAITIIMPIIMNYQYKEKYSQVDNHQLNLTF